MHPVCWWTTDSGRSGLLPRIHLEFTAAYVAEPSIRDESQVTHTAKGKGNVMDGLGTEDEQEYDDPSWYNTD
jgi:hypothetical protein